MKKMIILLLLISIGLLVYGGISNLNDLLVLLLCIQGVLLMYYVNKMDT